MFLIVETQLNIAFVILTASRYAQNPSHQHTEVVKTILKYMKGSKHCRITYDSQEKLLIKGYSDSVWAGDLASQKSTSGFIFMLNGSPVSWYLNRQSTVALSSTKVEYIALTLAAKKITQIRLLLIELAFLQSNQQYAFIKISKRNTSVCQIQ